MALIEEMEAEWGPRGSTQWPQWWYRMDEPVYSMVDRLVASAASEPATKSGGVVAGGLGAWAAVEEGVSTASADASESAKYDSAYW